MSKKERKRLRRVPDLKAEQRRNGCPHPEKAPYADDITALREMNKYGLSQRDGWGMYQCRCGFFHLTSNGQGLIQNSYA